MYASQILPMEFDILIFPPNHQQHQAGKKSRYLSDATLSYSRHHVEHNQYTTKVKKKKKQR